MILTQEQEQRLPKYAQDEIRRLRANVDYYKAKLMEQHEEETDVFVRVAYRMERGLPSGSTVIFVAEPEFGSEGRFEVYLDQETRELVVYGGDGCLIRPMSTNHIRLRIGR